MKKYYVYRMLSDKKVLYVGRTVNLKNRMANHFSLKTVREQEWKDEVDSIEYIEFDMYGDSVIYETYFIHKFKTPYNKLGTEEGLGTSITLKGYNWQEYDYTDKLKPFSRDFDNLEATHNISETFKEKCVKYVDYLNGDIECFEFDEYVVKIFKLLGKSKVKQLKYHKGNIKQYITNKPGRNPDVAELLNFPLDIFISGAEVSETFRKIYLQLELKKASKSTTIKDYYDVKETRKRIDGIQTRGYIVLNNKACGFTLMGVK